MDKELPAQLLAAVPHFAGSIFNVAWPNLIAWILAVVALFGAAWLRLPRLFERADRAAAAKDDQVREKGHESH